MRYKKRERRGTKFLRHVLLILCAAALFYVWKNSETTNAADALIRARNLIAQKQVEDVDSLLLIAMRNPALKPWAQLYRAQMYEAQGQQQKAIEQYLSVPTDRATSIDAKIALLRLGWKSERPEEFFVTLREEIVAVGRSDLTPELQLLEGMDLEERGELARAVSGYLELRQRFPKSNAAKKARERLRIIAGESPQIAKLSTMAELKAEAVQLLREEEPLLALEQIQQARRMTTENSADYFACLLTEEEILRKMKRHEEADELLTRVASDGPAGAADVAMLRIAKSAWNLNDHLRALEIIDTLFERYPQSETLEEGRYIAGRILEEMEHPSEAKATYKKLLAANPSAVAQVKSLKRLGFLQLLGQDYDGAALSFNQGLGAAHRLLSSQTGESRRDMLYFAFWEAESLRLGNNAARYPSAKTNGEPTDIFVDLLKAERKPTTIYQTISKIDRFGYYGYLARNRATTEEAPAGQDCPILKDSSLEKLLLDFSLMRDLAQREIDWHFGRIDPEKTEGLSFRRWRLSHSIASSDYGHTQRGIQLAESLLFRPEAESEGCTAALTSALFPLPLKNEFIRAAEEQKIAPSLLYALVREESRFDPLAKSSAGALGLGQMMPHIAKAAGLQNEQDLFDPSVNLRLSARHLAGLLKSLTERPFAIAAYNAGATPVNRWRSRYPDLSNELWTELISYPETNYYVKRVMASESIYASLLAK